MTSIILKGYTVSSLPYETHSPVDEALPGFLYKWRKFKVELQPVVTFSLKPGIDIDSPDSVNSADG